MFDDSTTNENQDSLPFPQGGVFGLRHDAGGFLPIASHDDVFRLLDHVGHKLNDLRGQVDEALAVQGDDDNWRPAA